MKGPNKRGWRTTSVNSGKSGKIQDEIGVAFMLVSMGVEIPPPNKIEGRHMRPV